MISSVDWFWALFWPDFRYVLGVIRERFWEVVFGGISGGISGASCGDVGEVILGRLRAFGQIFLTDFWGALGAGFGAAMGKLSGRLLGRLLG